MDSDNKIKLKLQISGLIVWAFMTFTFFKEFMTLFFGQSDYDAGFVYFILITLLTILAIIPFRNSSVKIQIPVSYFMLLYPVFLYFIIDLPWRWYTESTFYFFLFSFEIVTFSFFFIFKLKKYSKKSIIIADLFVIPVIITMSVFMFFSSNADRAIYMIDDSIEYGRLERAEDIIEQNSFFLSPDQRDFKLAEIATIKEKMTVMLQNEMDMLNKELIHVEGGTLYMNPDRKRGLANLDDFFISRTEVSLPLWDLVMDHQGLPKHDDVSASGISWMQAVEFCNKLSQIANLEPCYEIDESEVHWDYTKNGYRLPTEAEWVFAASGGRVSNGYTYAGSNDYKEVIGITVEKSDAIYISNSGATPNELGIVNMSGGVAEWCWDWNSDDFYTYPENLGTNPTGPDHGYEKILKGQVPSRNMVPYFDIYVYEPIIHCP